jgi:DNA-directed RNA polymerase specialized sigma24 family protein/LysM repeat protein
VVFEGSRQVFSKIEPLFQDDRVGDADLIEVLVVETYDELYLLAQVMLLDPELASLSVKKTISTAVAGRRGYWGELPLVVWMNRLLVEQCSRKGGDGWVKPPGEKSGPGLGVDPDPVGTLADFQDMLRKLSLEHRAALALRYGQQLSLEEIAAVLDVPVVRARAFLKSARKACLDASDLGDSYSRLPALEGVFHTSFLEQIEDAVDGLMDANQRSGLERHLGECQACRAKADELAALDKWLREQVFARLGKKVSQEDNHSLVSECLELVNRRSRKSRLALSSRQILYTVVLLALLVGVAMRVILPLEDASQPAALVTLPAPAPTHDPWEGYLKFTYHVSEGDTLEDLAEKSGLSGDAILELNRMSPGSQLYPGRELTLAIKEASFIPPSEKHELVLPERLTAQADESAVLERMAGAGDWVGTLWGEYRFILYGHSGYSGPPYLESRSQIWWHKDGYQVMLSGLSGGGGEGIYAQFSIPSGFTFNIDSSTTNLYAYQNQGGDIFNYFQNPAHWLGLENSAAKFQVVGSDLILGRPVLVVDWVGEQDAFAWRLWVDAERALVLRMRIFEDAGMQSTVMDWGFSDLALDVDLPARVFSPLSFSPSTFVRDYKAEAIPEGESSQEYAWSPPADRRPRARLSPPSGFDPAVEPLALQWPWNLLEGSELQVDVFAGEYFMGSLDLGPVPDVQDPHGHPSIPFDACTRSPDGRLAAFSVSRQSSFEPRIYWFNLANPESYREVITEMDTLGEFAFDPSSRYLAFYGCSTDVCGIQVLDIYLETLRMLYSPRRAGLISITWSPDGKYLAFVGSNPTNPMRKIFVIRVTNGAVVYEGDYGWEARSVPPDSPTLSWRMNFPKDESFEFFDRGCRDPFEYPHWIEHDRRD